MKLLRVDCETSSNQLSVPAGVGLIVAPVTRGDLYELQILVTDKGIPKDMTDWTAYGLFIFKTRDQYLNAGNFTDAFIGFATGSSYWDPTNGQLAIGFAVANDVAGPANFYTNIVLFNAIGDPWSLGTDPLLVPLIMPLYNATETNVPSGVPGSIRGDWTFEDTATTFDIDVPNATVNTSFQLSLRPSVNAGGPGDITQTVIIDPNPALSKVRLTVGSAPGMGGSFNGTYFLTQL